MPITTPTRSVAPIVPKGFFRAIVSTSEAKVLICWVAAVAYLARGVADLLRDIAHLGADRRADVLRGLDRLVASFGGELG